ncbi:glutathione S-transferase family protein [Tateyamaria sp. SN3-11]|uniref:glutathione S-transferase family protein n=1 Tax=Tateyamaria sp. SN3-11 TaxID=3092147 RepID=UPI0039E9138C
MKLYIHPVSGHAHRVTAMAALLDIDHEAIVVDLQNGAQKHPDYLKLNPMGQVPTLVDGDVVLRESTGILTYLAMKHDPERTWLPADPALTAKVQEWLATSVKEVFEGPCGARISKFFGAPTDFDQAVDKTHDVLRSLFEPHLATQDWLVGTGPTIADVANYGYISATGETGIPLDDYPSVRAWLTRIEALERFPRIPTVAEVMSGGN